MKNIIGNIALVIISTMIALAISEIGLRIIYPQSPTVFYQPHPVLGWELIPNKEGTAYGNVFEYQTGIKINSLGLRDDELDLSNKDKKTILVLGDSYTFSQAVEKNETFVEKLQNQLSLTLNKEVEVINAGRNGYGTAQELLLYRELSEKGLKPDLVFLMFFTNDILNNLCFNAKLDKTQNKPCYEIVDNELKLTHLPEINKNPRVTRWMPLRGFINRLYI